MTLKAARRTALELTVGLGALIAPLVVHGDDREALDTHRRLWEQASIGAYVYAYQKYCECHRETPPETYVTVRDAKVVDVRHQPFGFDHYVQAEPRNFEWYWTIDDLFDLVGNALERGSVVRVAFDAELGFPTQVFIDHDANLIGDEVDVRVTKLERLEE